MRAHVPGQSTQKEADEEFSFLFGMNKHEILKLVVYLLSSEHLAISDQGISEMENFIEASFFRENEVEAFLVQEQNGYLLKLYSHIFSNDSLKNNI